MAYTEVIFESAAGEEVRVPADALSAASAVWRERFALAFESSLAPAAGLGQTTRSKEPCTQLELESFAGIVTMCSHTPSMIGLLRRSRRDAVLSSADLGRLTAALTLIHKYDCGGAKVLVAHLAGAHFPNCRPLVKDATYDGFLPVAPMCRWLTQHHLDYIVRAQELFFADDGCGYPMVDDTMMAILAQALTTGLQWSTCTRFANGLHFTHQRVVVQAIEDVDCGVDRPPTEREGHEGAAWPEAEAPGGRARGATHVRSSYCASLRAYHLFQPPLVVERWRISAPTLSALLYLVAPRPGFRLTVVDSTDEAAGQRDEAAYREALRARYPAPRAAPSLWPDAAGPEVSAAVAVPPIPAAEAGHSAAAGPFPPPASGHGHGGPAAAA